jgi:outer membrane immunogenic protein
LESLTFAYFLGGWIMHKFRTQLLATAATMALGSAAFAADMAVKAPPPAPVPYVVNWTGFYAGLQIGGASFDPSCQSDHFTSTFDGGEFDPCFPFRDSDFQHTGGFSSASVIGGGRIGADYQWGSVVLGVVGQFDGTNLKGNQTTTFIDTSPSEFGLNVSDKIDWIASARGRIGWAFGNFLAYATGGVAFTEIKSGISAQFDGFQLYSTDSTSHKTGGVAGAGFEYMVAPHVSVAGEVLWYGFGSSTVSAVCAVCGGTTYSTTFNHEDVVAGTLGVNWRF